MLKTKAELVTVLKDILARVEFNDSFEGYIRYSCFEEDIKPGFFEVEAVYRIGNSIGQGGCYMIEKTKTTLIYRRQHE